MKTTTTVATTGLVKNSQMQEYAVLFLQEPSAR
jgi:hypothetical protein